MTVTGTFGFASNTAACKRVTGNVCAGMRMIFVLVLTTIRGTRTTRSPPGSVMIFPRIFLVTMRVSVVVRVCPSTIVAGGSAMWLAPFAPSRRAPNPIRAALKMRGNRGLCVVI